MFSWELSTSLIPATVELPCVPVPQPPVCSVLFALAGSLTSGSSPCSASDMTSPPSLAGDCPYPRCPRPASHKRLPTLGPRRPGSLIWHIAGDLAPPVGRWRLTIAAPQWRRGERLRSRPSDQVRQPLQVVASGRDRTVGLKLAMGIGSSRKSAIHQSPRIRNGVRA